MRAEINACRLLAGQPEWKRPLVNVRRDVRIKLEHKLKNRVAGCLLDSSG
jgi:hypothetical protein